MILLHIMTPSILIQLLRPLIIRTQAADMFMGQLYENVTSRVWLYDTFVEEDEFRAAEQTIESMKDTSEMYFLNNNTILECVTTCVEGEHNMSNLIAKVEGGEEDEIETLTSSINEIYGYCEDIIHKAYELSHMLMSIKEQSVLVFTIADHVFKKYKNHNEMNHDLGRPLKYNLTHENTRLQRMNNLTGWIQAFSESSIMDHLDTMLEVDTEEKETI